MTRALGTVDIVLTMCGWAALALVFLVRRTPPSSAPTRRDTAWSSGLLLQGAGMAAVWWWRRPAGSPLGRGSAAAEVLITLAVALLVAAGVTLVAGAVRALGRHWSISARTVAGHQLITSGPYRVVRHPIYTGLLALLLATGLTFSSWGPLAIGFVLFAAGTRIRGASEERPAVFPWPGLR
jgi:protein-S-isoprenylcysteine O-methyltransferase Ste14